MGGHGALTLFLKNPGMYKSVSAFAPITNPINCPWGQKAFGGYLGDDKEAWKKHDATELVRKWKGDLDILIDVVCLFILKMSIANEPRGLVIISTNKNSCYQRTLRKLLNPLVMIRDWC